MAYYNKNLNFKVNLLPYDNFSSTDEVGGSIGEPDKEFRRGYIRALNIRHIDSSTNPAVSDKYLYLGYNDTSKIKMFYSTQDENDRMEYFQVNDNGACALTRFGVNGQHISYTLFVDGTGLVTGNLGVGTTSVENKKLTFYDKNRGTTGVWAGYSNSEGTWYIYDSTLKRMLASFSASDYITFSANELRIDTKTTSSHSTTGRFLIKTIGTSSSVGTTNLEVGNTLDSNEDGNAKGNIYVYGHNGVLDLHLEGSDGTSTYDAGGVLRLKNSKNDAALTLWADREGGNIRIYPPSNYVYYPDSSGVYSRNYWDIDAYDGNLRIFSYHGGDATTASIRKEVRINRDGTIVMNGNCWIGSDGGKHQLWFKNDDRSTTKYIWMGYPTDHDDGKFMCYDQLNNKTIFTSAADGTAYFNGYATQSIGAVSKNGFFGMATPDLNDGDWIRTTSQGIIPYQSGGIGQGHQSIGTDTWYFATSYVQQRFGITYWSDTNAVGGGFKWRHNSVNYGDSYISELGTTSARGTMFMRLGNNKATGTADNARGILQIMSASDRIGLELYGDAEGGNITIFSGNGHTNTWEMDSYNGNFRLYNWRESDGSYQGLTISQDNCNLTIPRGGISLGSSTEDTGAHIEFYNSNRTLNQKRIWMGYANSGNWYIWNGNNNKGIVSNYASDGHTLFHGELVTDANIGYGSTLPSSGTAGQVFFKI